MAQIARHLPQSRVSGTWKKESTSSAIGSSSSTVPAFKNVDRQAVKVSLTEASPNKAKDPRVATSTPTISEDGSVDDGVTIHCNSPVVTHGGSASSPSTRKA